MQTSGHRVLITGGAKGIGLAIATSFHAAGNEVILVGRDAAALQIAATTLPGAIIHIADIASTSDRAALVMEFRDITVLVNNAGVQRNGEFSTMSAADIENEIHVNLLAPMLLTHAFLPHLQTQTEAAIVNVTSVLALMPKQSASAYCVSEAALHSFSISLRWQLENTSVQVFEIMPPLVDTAMTANRSASKISPAALASAFWAGFQRDKYELRVGKAKAASLIVRVAPSLAEKIMRGA